LDGGHDETEHLGMGSFPAFDLTVVEGEVIPVLLLLLILVRWLARSARRLLADGTRFNATTLPVVGLGVGAIPTLGIRADGSVAQTAPESATAVVSRPRGSLGGFAILLGKTSKEVPVVISVAIPTPIRPTAPTAGVGGRRASPISVIRFGRWWRVTPP
jgi:hypothetical protein